jgi:hypothetical protein
MKISRILYKWARLSRDVNAVNKTASKLSPTPLLKRAANKRIGKIVGKLFLK